MANKDRYTPLKINRSPDIGRKQIIKVLKSNGRFFLASKETASIPAADPKGVHPPPNAPEKTKINHK